MRTTARGTRAAAIGAALAFGLAIVAASAVSGISSARAQDAAAPAKTDSLGWKKELIGSLNFTQSSFSNWVAGGVDNTSWITGASGRFKQFGAATNWTTSLRLEYGRVKEKGQESRKSFDLIFLETILDFNTSRLIKPYARASGKSQFSPGYDYTVTPKVKVSAFADPLYLEQGAGVGYQAAPGLITRFGFGAKETFAKEFASIYTDDKNTADKIEKHRIEGGLESLTELNQTVGKQLSLKSRLALFWPFDDTKRVDADWMTDVTLKALGAIGVTFKFEALYNKTILDKVQWQQVLGVGITYAFI